MKIDITRLPSEKSVSFQEIINQPILDLDKEGINLSSSLEIEADVFKDLSTVNIKANIKTKLSFVCSRCLENFERDINREIKFNYPINLTEPIIDLTNQIREEMILSDMPIKPICKDDCKGLCIKCGQNLNKGTCSCR